MAPPKKRGRPSNLSKTRKGEQKLTLDESTVQVSLRGNGHTDDLPLRLNNDTATQALIEETTDSRENGSDKAEAFGHATYGKAHYALEQEKGLLTIQKVFLCTICGGPLAMKAEHQAVYPEILPFHQFKIAMKPGLRPWMHKIMFLAILLEHLQADPQFIPEQLSHLDFVQERHETFSKYAASWGLATTPSDRVSTSEPPSHPQTLRVTGMTNGRNEVFKIWLQADMQKRNVSKEIFGQREVQDGVKPNGTSAAYPMHENCYEVANRYIVAANRNGDRLMKMEGVSSWVDLYRYLKTHQSLHQEGICINDEDYPGDHDPAEPRSIFLECRKTSKVFKASPIDSSYTTVYLLSKLRPLPRSTASVARNGGPVRTIPSQHADVPWLSIPLHRGSLQWLLLEQTTLDLPPSLVTFVQNEVCGLHNPPLTRSVPTYLPEYWREILLKGFPWLWDLDHEQCRLKDSETYDDESKIRWDWERLVRQLAQDDVFTSEEGLQNAPDGLRNRRRIWQLLDEMRAPLEEVSEKSGGDIMEE